MTKTIRPCLKRFLSIINSRKYNKRTGYFFIQKHQGSDKNYFKYRFHIVELVYRTCFFKKCSGLKVKVLRVNHHLKIVLLHREISVC